jgi:threonine aldolase
MNSIDLRSDTVSWPTPAMREAMASAEVGDDVWGDDPTVNRLQEMAAERVGQEAALFVPSGTMGNLAAALAHCGRGDELILGDQSHTFRYEAGGVAVLGGIHPHPLPNQPDGTLRLEDIEGAVRDDNPHFPHSRAIFLENTHNICGGRAIPPDYFAAVRGLADRHSLLVHLDGARVFNAAAALGCPVAEITRHVDSVMFCLSKGLCAPVGSLLCGPADFIYRARRARKVLGGGMRQAGILAAAGIVALEQMVDRLVEDHTHAKRLAEGLARIPGVEIDPDTVESNLIFFGLSQEAAVDPAALISRLDREHNIKIGGRGGRQFRAVTHYWITSQMIDTTLAAVREIIQAG